MFTAEQLEEKKDEVPKKSDTRMTASILKQNPNTKQRLKRMLFIMTKNTKQKHVNTWGKSLFQTITF